MYVPQHFEVTDREKMLAFIEANAFGQLVSTVGGRLFASYIPFILGKEGKSLVCHVAKGNPQWKDIENQEVLVTFQGPHGYISPSWYELPGVPTWNYQVIHIYGRAKLITNTGKLRNIVNDLTEKYESSFQKPWKPEYKESLLGAIVGIEIDLDEIQGKYKLSQNRSENDRRQAVDKLEAIGSVMLSKAMKNEL
jgi:transcriptional regulator